MKKSEKSEISKEFARLRNFGFDVYNFNDYRPMYGGKRDFVDHVLVSKKYHIYIEVKIGEDKLTDGQKRLAEKISHLSTTNPSIHYRLVRTLKEAKSLVNLLLAKKL